LRYIDPCSAEHPDATSTHQSGIENRKSKIAGPVMRVGIDARALTGRYTGDRTYWLNLLRAHVQDANENPASAPDYVVYSRLPVPEDALPPSPNVTLRWMPARSDRTWTLLAFPAALRRDGIDVAHTQYTTPLRASCPLVTTVHDVSFKLHPEWFPRKHRLLLNLTVPMAMRRAAMVITDTESSRTDMLRVYRLAANHLVAILLAAGPEYAPVPQETARSAAKHWLRSDEPYVLSVGVLQPRKNLRVLLDGFAEARRIARLPHRLLLTGKPGWGYTDLGARMRELGIADTVTQTGYVDDSALPALYSAAGALAYPSLYEGFGLPPLEAMACGCPVVASDAPAMPEVTGGAARIVPAEDSPAWGAALAEVLTDATMRDGLRERGLRRAAQFSWRKTAEETRAVYARVAGARRPLP
jgi:glycosyltransferase involved in cell wall biosynthesis